MTVLYLKLRFGALMNANYSLLWGVNKSHKRAVNDNYQCHCKKTRLIWLLIEVWCVHNEHCKCDHICCWFYSRRSFGNSVSDTVCRPWSILLSGRHWKRGKRTQLNTGRAFVSLLWQYCSQLSCKWGALDWVIQGEMGRTERDKNNNKKGLPYYSIWSQQQRVCFKFSVSFCPLNRNVLNELELWNSFYV